MREWKIYNQVKNNYKKEILKIYAQPLVSFDTDKYNLAESLVRLELNDGTVAAPGEFFPLLSSEQLVELDFHVLKKVDEFISESLDDKLMVSVNFSFETIKILGNKYLFCNVDKIKNRDRIVIEISEAVTADKSLEAIKKLKKYGFKLAIDDFPAARTFEFMQNEEAAACIDVLKIDKSAFLGSGKTQAPPGLLESSYGLARSLFKGTLVMEGAETEEHINSFLELYHSDRLMFENEELAEIYIQGYYYARPGPIEDLNHFYVKEEKINVKRKL